MANAKANIIEKAGLTLEEFLALVQDSATPIVLSEVVLSTLKRSREAFEKARAKGDVYGVSTGFGASVVNQVSAEFQSDLALNLTRFHGCGWGPALNDQEVRAVMLARLSSLTQGLSGIRPEVAIRLCEMLNQQMYPVIPSRGSVGASGDLTPLSYIAAAMYGEREVRLQGTLLSSEEALKKLGLERLKLEAKESLALMNGTSFMLGLAILGFKRTKQLAEVSARSIALAIQASQGNPQHYDARIFAAKAHPGSIQYAAWLRAELQGYEGKAARLQDRYSFRCSPHIIGQLLDELGWLEPVLTIELNGSNDNPLFDPEEGEALHGGNFYGGHICLAADHLRAAIANLAEVLERQLILLCDSTQNGGLPENLVGVAGDAASAHHGFKAMQITASSLMAELNRLVPPASPYSRSTESHNQDKVSMGSLAVLDLLRALDLAEAISAIHLLASAQAARLRGAECLSPRSSKLLAWVEERSPKLTIDRPLQEDIVKIAQDIGQLASISPSQP